MYPYKLNTSNYYLAARTLYKGFLSPTYCWPDQEASSQPLNTKHNTTVSNLDAANSVLYYNHQPNRDASNIYIDSGLSQTNRCLTRAGNRAAPYSRRCQMAAVVKWMRLSAPHQPSLYLCTYPLASILVQNIKLFIILPRNNNPSILQPWPTLLRKTAKSLSE